MAYQINLTGQEIDERLQNVGTAEDAAAAGGTLYARVKKNADNNDELSDAVGRIGTAQTATNKTVTQHTSDISTLQRAVSNNKTRVENVEKVVNQHTTTLTEHNARQTNIEKVVSGARSEAYFSLRLLNLIVSSKFLADIDNIKVVLYRWSGKSYSELEMFTKNDIGESQKEIQYKIILKQDDKDGANIRTPYIHYNDDATEESLVGALRSTFGGRISYSRHKKRRWRIQAFLNDKPITAPFDFRVSIGNGPDSLTKGGMMRSVPSTGEVVYDGCFDGDSWLHHKKGSQFNIVFFQNENTIRRFPTPGDPVSATGETYGAVVAVKENATATAITYNILWTNGIALYEIGVLDDAGAFSYICTSPAKKLCDDIYDYASKMNSGTLRDLYISAGAKYNETTGYYELNGLTDITEEEMRTIYKYAGTPQVTGAFAYSKARTNLPMPGMYNGNLMATMFYSCSNLEVVYLGYRRTPPDNYDVPIVSMAGNNSFYLCQKLKKIYGKITCFAPNINWDLTFGECLALEEVRIALLNSPIKLQWSPNLSKESVQYMITNANPPSGAAVGSITITLHPTAYARLKGDADIVAALEAKGGIVTLVSA